jgi:hypothetical protein
MASTLTGSTPVLPTSPMYPGGDPDEGTNYLEFLKIVRGRLPADKTRPPYFAHPCLSPT